MTSRTMNIERMQETIALLRAVPPEQFDYSGWGKNPEQWPRSCQTVACAGGWMTLHKPFNDQGLSHPHRSLAPLFKGLLGEDALALFLGITNRQAEAGFVLLGNDSAKSEVTAKDVANYLEKLLNAKLKRDARHRKAPETGT